MSWAWCCCLASRSPRGSRCYDRAGAVVDLIGAGFEATPADEAAWMRDLQRRLKHVHLSRRVIEGQFAGVLVPGGWTGAYIGQLQVALVAAEQGLAQMIEGVSDRSHITNIPGDIQAPLTRSLRSLHAALLAGGADSMQILAQESATLQTNVRSHAKIALQNQGGDVDAPLAPWVASALRLVGGSYQVAQSIVQARALAAQVDSPLQLAENRPGATSAKQPGAGLPPLVRGLGGLKLHPTTALGIQAVLATGLAMLVARLLNLDHSNWVFWTAFVVIAGSTGGSLRKMMMRAVGTVGGAAIGVVLALLAPDNTILVVAVATVCMFLTIFFAPVSYPQMVFWLNIGFVMVYTLLGGRGIRPAFCASVDYADWRDGGGAGGCVYLPDSDYRAVQSGCNPFSKGGG